MIPFPRSSAAAERPDNKQPGTRGDGGQKALLALLPDKKENMPPYPILFVDHPEAEAGELAIQVVQRRPQGGPFGLHLAPTTGVAA